MTALSNTFYFRIYSVLFFWVGVPFVSALVVSHQQHYLRNQQCFWSSLQEGGQPINQDLLEVRNFLQDNYPMFYTILDKNEEVWKAIGDDNKEEYGYTIFALSDASIQNLGETKWTQLMDPRNLETTQKIASYHVINEVVTAEQIYDSGGLVTMAGEIPVERSVTGGIFGLGGQEDGGVLINKARATQTWQVGSGLIHEVDNFVSPNILWRFMDQLRIPGSS